MGLEEEGEKRNGRVNVKPKQRDKLNVDLVMLLACRATSLEQQSEMKNCATNDTAVSGQV